MKQFILFLWLLLTGHVFGQNEESDLQKVLRVNAISPGIELELPISNNSTFSINPGIGFQGALMHISSVSSGITYYIAPFLDLTFKRIYNRENRALRGKNSEFNAGNYLGLRLLTNFEEFESLNLRRKDDISFVFGPTWGIQRTFGEIHFLFDLGPIYYFDTKGNHGIFPFMFQLNLGFNMEKW